MGPKQQHYFIIPFFFFFLFFFRSHSISTQHLTGRRRLTREATASIPLSEEMEILLEIKESILKQQPSTSSSIFHTWTRGESSNDSTESSAPCKWKGLGCTSIAAEGIHVTSIDLSFNNLQGTIPLGLSNLTYLSTISFAFNQFVGTIPSDIIYCTNLISLDLSNNLLYGSILPALTLTHFNLAFLNLSTNNFNTPLDYDDPFNGPDLATSPTSPPCISLQSLNISSNAFGGQLPPLLLTSCKNLITLDASNASLHGPLPLELGQIPTLEHLVLRGNGFAGPIPPQIFDSCQNLRELDLGLNNLTSDLPPQISNCTRLQDLILSGNNITALPSQIGSITTLQRLLVTHNSLTTLPEELATCTNLHVLALSANHVAGDLPHFIGRLTSLQFLSLYSNSFTGTIPSWLGALTLLRHLDLSQNQLQGEIPEEISSIQPLQFLILSGNYLTGRIPDDFGKLLVNLQVLDVSSNHLTGRIPSSIGNLQHLLWLMLANNELSGELPVELGNCSSLLWLNAASNNLSGELPESLASIGNDVDSTFALNERTLPLIPKAMGECNAVRRWIPSHYPPFDLITNVMTIERCRSFWNLLMRGVFMYPLCPSRPPSESMGYIQLSQNRFSGQVPKSLRKCKHLGLLFLDQNILTGNIPSDLAGSALTGLNLSRNALTGSVPPSIGELTCLVSLDFSYNNLSGTIPMELQNLTQLNRFNISYNPDLFGPIPTAQQFSTFGPTVYSGNHHLCMSAAISNSNKSTKIPFCGGQSANAAAFGRERESAAAQAAASRIAVATIVGISLACTLGLIVLVLLGVCLLGKSPPPNSAMDFMMVGKEHRQFDNAMSVQVSLFSVELPKHLTYADLVSATNNFDEANVVGSGGFGVVYKAKLADGSLVAVKKLIQEGPQADREFLAEMETLGHVHHENLVPLLGCSSCGTQKLLVYKFMENGSLDDWLHERPGGAESLDWPIRLNVALGIARGLKFLHHNCSPPVVHRDMKGSNILLDVNFEPRLTDFGLARVLGAHETHVSTVVAGTLGYVPPEYCQTWRATAKGDVYSFGVVLLELVTGRRPMSICFSEKDCGNLIDWAAYHLRKNIAAEVYDPIVSRSGAPAELVAFLKLAVACTAEMPVRRPTMREVLKVLEEIKAGNYSVTVASIMQQPR